MTFVDPRDHQEYPIVELGGQMWFGSNLKYASENSWCSHGKAREHCELGNFYHYSELENVCPDEWHVPTWDEWKRAIEAILDRQGIALDSVPWKKWPERWAEKERHEFIEGISLYNDTLGLNVKRHGWVQGEVWEDPGATTFWVIDSHENDPPAHIHILDSTHKKHAHKHNIYSKPEKQRRFAVRCVSDIADQ